MLTMRNPVNATKEMPLVGRCIMKKTKIDTKDLKSKQFMYGGVSPSSGLKENNECLECKRKILKARDAFHYEGMLPYTYYCRNCYFKKL